MEALAQNQELQLKNDSLGVQVQVLQSERSAQMFLYGASTLGVGVLLGFLIGKLCLYQTSSPVVVHLPIFLSKQNLRLL